MVTVMKSPVTKEKNKAFKRSFKAYIDNVVELVEKYPDMYVAFCDGKIIDRDLDLQTLVKRLNENSVDLNACMIEYISPNKEDLLL